MEKFFLVALKNKKKQIHYAVMAIAIGLLIWNVSVLCHITFSAIPWVLAVSERIYFIGIIFVSMAVLFTNPYHHFFYKTFSLIPSEQDFGFYFVVHTAYSYLCIGIGLFQRTQKEPGRSDPAE